MDGRGPVGPLAIIVSAGNHFDAAHFADAAVSNRPLQIFRDKGKAMAWLVQAANSKARRR